MERKLISYTICNNEATFIKDIVEFHLPWLDAMLFIDNGSTDGTLEYLKSIARTNPKLIVEEYPVKFTPDYSRDWYQMVAPFPEVEVRNQAIQRTEELFPDSWVLQLDGDDLWLPKVREVLENLPADASFLGCSTHNPVVPLSSLPKERRGGVDLYDPHIRAWKTGEMVQYIKNPAFRNHPNDQMHCIPATKIYPRHLFLHPKARFTTEGIQFALHWAYGEKVRLYFENKGITDRQQIIADHQMNEFSHLVPQVFWDRRQEWVDSIVRPLFPLEYISMDLEATK
jgi:glycosyltransferase involved in cell wall biosynthesis